MRTDFVNVEPWEVQHGDILAGVPGAKDRPIDSILMDGNDGWWIYASRGRILDRRAPWSRVQVVREVVQYDGDPTPPHGIHRSHGGRYLEATS